MKYPKAESTNRDEWIMQVPVITTAHFSQAEAELLYASAYLAERVSNPQTALLHLSDYDEGQPIREQLSEGAIKLVEYFRSLGYSYLRLDPDGDDVEGFPKFEW